MSTPYNPAAELVAIVDRENNVTGAVTRREMRAQGLLHRSTYILAFRSNGDLFVQKRTMTKDVYPGYWDPVAGGVVQAEESYEESAERELAEELGIRGVAVEPLFEFYFEDGAIRVWGKAFRSTYDGKLTPQPEEVAGGEYMSIDEITRRAEFEPFTADGLHVIRRYKEMYP